MIFPAAAAANAAVAVPGGCKLLIIHNFGSFLLLRDDLLHIVRPSSPRVGGGEERLDSGVVLI